MYIVKLNIENSVLEKVVKYLKSFSDKIEIVDIQESEKNVYNSNLSHEQERILKEREEAYLSGRTKIFSWEEAKSDVLKK